MGIEDYVTWLLITWITITAALMLMDLIDWCVQMHIHYNDVKEDSKYTQNVQRNYESFKSAIGSLVLNNRLTEEEINKNYLYAKAELYHINIDRFSNDLTALEKEILHIEASEKITESNRIPYYSN